MNHDRNRNQRTRGLRLSSNFSLEALDNPEKQKNLTKSEIFTYNNHSSPHQAIEQIYLESSQEFNKQGNDNKRKNQMPPPTLLMRKKHQVAFNGQLNKPEKHYIYKGTRSNHSLIQNSKTSSHLSALNLLESLNPKIVNAQTIPMITTSPLNSQQYQRLLEKNGELTDQLLKMSTQKSKLALENLDLQNKITSKGLAIEALHEQIASYRKLIGNLEQNERKLKQDNSQLQLDAYKFNSEMDYYKNKYYQEFNRNEEILKTAHSAQSKEKQLHKLKQLVFGDSKQEIGSEQDSQLQIQAHIKYEALLAESQERLRAEIDFRIKQTEAFGRKQQVMNRQIDQILKGVNKKIKEISSERQKIEDELKLTRNQSQGIRKKIFKDFQQMINQQKDRIIELKEQNFILENNNTDKIAVMRLEGQMGLLRKKNDDIMIRNKQLQEACERLKKFALDCQKASSEYQAETTIKASSISGFQGFSNSQFDRIVNNYEQRIHNLADNIAKKQLKQEQTRLKINNLEQQLQQAKSKVTLASKTNKSSLQNNKTALDALKLQLKSEAESASRKIEALENNIKRKSKEIKQKDQFIINYLLQRVKGQRNVQQVITEIQSHFKPAESLQN